MSCSRSREKQQLRVCVSVVPSLWSDAPSEWSAPASEPSPELPWHVLGGGERTGVTASNMEIFSQQCNMMVSLSFYLHLLLTNVID